MKIVAMTCPHCNASLRVDASEYSAVCEYCGARFALQRDLTPETAEAAGYAFEKGRERARIERYAESSPVPQPGVEAERASPAPDRHKRLWLWVIGCIFCFPIPLSVLIGRKKEINIYVRIGLILLVWAFFLFLSYLGSEDTAGTAAQAAAMLFGV